MPKDPKRSVIKKKPVDWTKSFRIEDQATTYVLAYGDLPYLELDFDQEFSDVTDAEKEAKAQATEFNKVHVVQKTVRTSYNAPFQSEDPFSIW